MSAQARADSDRLRALLAREQDHAVEIEDGEVHGFLGLLKELL